MSLTRTKYFSACSDFFFAGIDRSLTNAKVGEGIVFEWKRYLSPNNDCRVLLKKVNFLEPLNERESTTIQYFRRMIKNAILRRRDLPTSMLMQQTNTPRR